MTKHTHRNVGSVAPGSRRALHSPLWAIILILIASGLGIDAAEVRPRPGVQGPEGRVGTVTPTLEEDITSERDSSSRVFGFPDESGLASSSVRATEASDVPLDAHLARSASARSAPTIARASASAHFLATIDGEGSADDWTPNRVPVTAAWPAAPQVQEPMGPEDTAGHSVSLSIVPAASDTRDTNAAESLPPTGCPVTALPNDNSTSGNARAPNLRVRFARSVYLIRATELAAAGIPSGTGISGIGWSFQAPPGLSGSGPLIVYLQNTADTTNTKSTNWTTAISGMTIVHNATTTIPNVSGPWDISFSGGSPFTYTGGGLYVAFDAQYPVGTLSTTTVVWCNSTGLVGGLLGAQSNTSAPTTLAASSFRPETRLTPSTATVLDDASVEHVISYGAVPRDLVGPQVAQAVVANRGANALTNLPVTLTVTGGDSFTDTQIVPSLAACGGQATVIFAGFTASALGTDTLTVSVPPDDVATNNSKAVPMNVTVPEYSFKYPGTTATGGVGLGGTTGAFVGKFTTTFPTSVTGVTLEFAAASATAYRVAIYADSGTGTPGALLYVDGADRTVTAAGPVTLAIGPVPVGSGNFYAGIHQTNTTNASLSFDNEVPIRSGKFYFAAPLPVTGWIDFSPGNNFKMNVGVILDPCAGGPAVCDDGNPCTSDSCDRVAGCVHTPTNCDDGNACTHDSCDPATGCVGTPINCDDANPCTDDSCDPATGCVHVNICGTFPPAGTDLSPTTGTFHVDVAGMGAVETSVSGMTLLQWQDPQTDPATGQRTVQTELLSMNLSGSSPTLGSLSVRGGVQQGLPRSLGSVRPLGAGSDFPARATFDVFFEVEVGGSTTLRNSEPLVMEADITEIPPRNVGLRNANPVLITSTLDPRQASVLQTAQHWMCPPPFPPPGVPCPVPCERSPFPVCSPGDCPGICSDSGAACRSSADCVPAPQTCLARQCVPNAATGRCECRPGFPPAGTDLSPTVGNLLVDVIGVGPVEPQLSGRTLLQWQNPQTDPTTGQRTVQTEMLSLDLQGSHPSIGNLHVTAGGQQGLPPTLGSVRPVNPGADFPARATFDVFFEVEVQGVATLRNDQPLVMEADITEIPPRSVGLRNAAPVRITDVVNPQHVDTIRTAQHWMCPPPFPPPGVPCPVPCGRRPFPVCEGGACPAGQRCVPFASLPFPPFEVEVCFCAGVFPPAGTDLSPTVGSFLVDLEGIGSVETSVSGQTLLQWQNPVTDPGTGQRTVQTELLSLDLAGSHPSIGNLTVQAGSQQGLPPSSGSVTPLNPDSDFPALATFDVFFEVEVDGTTTLRNDQPLVMRAPITEIPPRSIGLQNVAPVPIRNLVNPGQLNTIQTAQHWMCPPPFPPPGVPCPVPCERRPFPVCKNGSCPPDRPLCVRDSVNQACRCVRPFPPRGLDLSPSTGIFRVDVAGVGQRDAQVSGEVLLRWQDPSTDPTGRRTVQTEMLSLDLAGSAPGIGSLNVRGGSNQGLPPSLGRVTPIDPGTDFPALATFDVFFEVEVGGVTTLRNDEPLVMEAEITEIPPRNIGLRNVSPVLITSTLDPSQVSVLRTAQHWMCPPPFPPPGVPCPVPCNRAPFPVCSPGDCPGKCSASGAACRSNADCPAPQTCIGVQRCVPNAATGRCECRPGFPPAGTDLSPTVGNLLVDVIGVGPVEPQLAGQTLLQWRNPQTDPTTGHRSVQTEMLSLDLAGSHPSIGNLHVTAGSQQGLPPTLGRVTPLDPAGADFPARATFDVFFEVEVQGVATLRNNQPLVMEADINEIPPRSVGLRNAAPVRIIDVVNPQHVDTIRTAQHWMCPPPFPPPGAPCPVPCNRRPFPVCAGGACPTPSQRCVPLAPFFAQDGRQGSCVCVGAFPPAGTDLSPTVGSFLVDLESIGSVETKVSGQTLLQWQNPVTDPGTGQRTVQTELLSLDLAGSHPSIGNLSVQAGSGQGLPPSTGRVTPLAPGSDFPALATFDVFFEVVVDGTTTLRNDQPLVMRAPITEIPPRSIGLQNAAPVPIRNLVNPGQLNTIQTAQHWMCPPPFPPPGVPCPVPCERNPFPVCRSGVCPPDRPLCVRDVANQACRCVRPFPPRGLDLSPTTGLFRVDIAGIGPTDAQVSGEVLLRWRDAANDPTGRRTVQTEMLSLDLRGSSPSLGSVRVRGGSNFGLSPTLGSVTPVDAGGDFPALATFDVFFEVDAGGTTLVNDQPLVMQAEITEIPPRSISLRNAAPVPLRNVSNPGQPNSVQVAAHWMCPPPFPPPGVPCPVQCSQTPAPLCSFGACPPGLDCRSDAAGRCACVAPPPPASGAVPDRAPDVPLRLGKAAGGQITLTWGASCLTTDTDYSIYEGQVPNFYSHASLFCSTGGATTMTFAPSAGRRYYLVVPHETTVEGSYGTRSSGVQRPQGAPACLPQAIGPCP